MARNAFGRLLIDPGALDRRERIDELRRCAGQLQSGDPDPAVARWLGGRLLAWLHGGGKFERYVGIAAKRGSHATARRIIARERRDALLLRFAIECGCDRTAIAVLRGDTECPPAAVDALHELRRMGNVPKAHDAISRARRRLAPHG